MNKCKEEFEKWLNKEFSHMKNTNWATHYWLVWQAAWNARVPEEYAVVPQEPTSRMLRACPVDKIVCMDIDAPSVFYKAMIAVVEEE